MSYINPLTNRRFSRPITQGGLFTILCMVLNDIQSLPFNKKKTVLRVLGQKNFRTNILFLNIFQIFLQKLTPSTLFTLFWYTTLHMRKKILHRGPKGSQGPKNLSKKFNDIYKLFKLGFVKRFFWLKQKNCNYFCTGCPKSALRWFKNKFLDLFS